MGAVNQQVDRQKAIAKPVPQATQLEFQKALVQEQGFGKKLPPKVEAQRKLLEKKTKDAQIKTFMSEIFEKQRQGKF